jgi:DNA-binding response OmpR family regulator
VSTGVNAGRPTVLIIEDDESVREIVAMTLRAARYNVLEAEDGLKGVELARSQSIDAVITDLVMPVQEGVETILTLRRERPRLPIIAISGGVTNSKLYLDIAGKIGANRLLPKPFTPKELIAVVEEVLAEVPPRFS